MITELNNVNIYFYKLQGKRSCCRLAICAENKEKAYEHAQKIKKEEYNDYDYVVQEDEISNTKDLNFEIAQ